MLYVVIFFIIGLAVILLQTKGSLSASLKRKDESLLVYSIKWIGYTRRREINLSDFSSKLIEGEKAEALDSNAGEILSVLKHARALYLAKRKSVRKIVRFIWRHLEINELNAQITSGGNDACLIAVKTGLIYSVTGIIDSILSNLFKIKSKKIFIEPDFSSKKTEMNISCILKMRFVNIIIAVIWTRLIYKKFKKEERR